MIDVYGFGGVLAYHFGHGAAVEEQRIDEQRVDMPRGQIPFRNVIAVAYEQDARLVRRHQIGVIAHGRELFARMRRADGDQNYARRNFEIAPAAVGQREGVRPGRALRGERPFRGENFPHAVAGEIIAHGLLVKMIGVQVRKQQKIDAAPARGFRAGEHLLQNLRRRGQKRRERRAADAVEQQARAAAFDQHARVGGACQGKIHALCSLRRNDGKAGSEMTTALPPERKYTAARRGLQGEGDAHR